jgi:hypothetical protein
MAYKPNSSILIWWLVVVSHHTSHLTSNKVVEPSPYLVNHQLDFDIILVEESLVRNLQKKKIVPTSPNNKIPTGAEFHRSVFMWKPR